MAGRGYEADSRANDDPALANARQHHVEQFALAIGGTSDKAAIAGHDVQLRDGVDLRAVMNGRHTDTAHAERATYGQRQARRWENRRGQAFGEGHRCHIGPECTRLRIHTLRASLDIVEISRIDDDAV